MTYGPVFWILVVLAAAAVFVFFERLFELRRAQIDWQDFLKGVITKKSTSQFIFTTHDTNLLDADLLRRDEIHFVEKDMNGCSHITSLSDYRISDGLRIGKGYLYGRFGAIPYLKKLQKF